MDDKKKKMVAPIIITILFVIYLVIYFAVIINEVTGIMKVLLAVVPLALAAVMIYVCIQRINEIKGGDEDDLSKYWLY